MKQKLTLFFSFFVLAATLANAQNENKSNCRRLLGVHLNAMDVNTPQGWKDNSIPKTLNGLREQDLGFSLSYWKLIDTRIDFSAKATMMFHNYSAVDRGVYSTKFNQLGLELEPTVNVKAFEDNYNYNAFVTAGLGLGSYSNKFGMYAPVGLGLQANLGNSTYIMLQSQYRFTLMKDVLKDNLFYSIGFIGKMGDDDQKTPKLPPPPPVVDRDGDGVLDKDDKCPEVAGKPELNGCPDKDNDGIADGEDKCPSVAGTAKYKGCPVPDTDGDGINDELDKCPKEKGTAKYNGCPIPDSDKDGVNDEMDKCPNAAGPANNQGCPVIKKEIIEKVSYEAKNIFFETNSAQLAESSKKALDGVFEILKSDRTLNLTIEGHSDNTGNAENNKTLSQARADAVRDYFMSKGILATRLKSTGYGSEKPIADNSTEEGRSKNRRTELIVNNH